MSQCSSSRASLGLGVRLVGVELCLCTDGQSPLVVLLWNPDARHWELFLYSHGCVLHTRMGVGLCHPICQFCLVVLLWNPDAGHWSALFIATAGFYSAPHTRPLLLGPRALEGLHYVALQYTTLAHTVI